MKPRTELSMQLYNMMLERGYSENLCDVVTRNLNTDYTATRMIGYLSHYSFLPYMEVVDEMLAILSDRNVIMRKKEAEQSRAKMNNVCPKCGGQLTQKKGKYGAFIGCSNYPECRYTRKV